MKKILLLFLFAMAMHATMVNAQPHIERLKEKHRVDGWSFRAEFGYSSPVSSRISFRDGSDEASIEKYDFLYRFPRGPYRPNNPYGETDPEVSLFYGIPLSYNYFDFAATAEKGLSKHLSLRLRLMHRTNPGGNGWRYEEQTTGHQGLSSPAYPYLRGDLGSFHETGLEGVLLYDLWSKKRDKKLNLALSLGSRYMVVEEGVFFDTREVEYEEYFQGIRYETFKRTGVSFMWGLGIERVHYFNKNWGYSIGVHLDNTYLFPMRMFRTKLTLGDEDLLPDLSTREKEFKFGDVSNDNPNDLDQPRIISRENKNLNFFMARVGICYRL